MLEVIVARMFGRISDAMEKHMGFVEVADGRVSRLHCMVRRQVDERNMLPFLEVRTNEVGVNL